MQRAAVAFEIPGRTDKNKYFQLRGQEDNYPGVDAAVHELLVRLRALYQERLRTLKDWMRQRFS